MEIINRCLDCSDSKSILIKTYNHGLFGDTVYLCEDCHNVRYGNNYFLKRERSKKPINTKLKLVKF